MLVVNFLGNNYNPNNLRYEVVTYCYFLLKHVLTCFVCLQQIAIYVSCILQTLVLYLHLSMLSLCFYIFLKTNSRLHYVILCDFISLLFIIMNLNTYMACVQAPTNSYFGLCQFLYALGFSVAYSMHCFF